MFVMQSNLHILVKAPTSRELVDCEFFEYGFCDDDKWINAKQFAVAENQEELSETPWSHVLFDGKCYDIQAELEAVESELYRKLEKIGGDKAQALFAMMIKNPYSDDEIESFEEVYDTWSEGGEAVSGRVESSSVCLPEFDGPVDPKSVMGFDMSFRVGEIDDKFIIEKDGEKVLDAEKYLKSDEYAAFDEDDNYVDKLEYHACGAKPW